MSVVVSGGQETLSLVLDEEQQMLRSTVRQFVDQHAPVGRLRALRDTRDERGFSDALWSEMAALGWLGLQLPEAHDGLGLGQCEAFLVAETAGRQLLNLPLASSAVLLPLLLRESTGLALLGVALYLVLIFYGYERADLSPVQVITGLENPVGVYPQM